jgi:hypothetical protein
MECTNHNITRYYQGGRWRCAVIINYGGINIYNTLTSSYADCGYQRNWWKVGLCHCLQLLLQMSLVAASIHIIRSHPHIQIYIYIYIYIMASLQDAWAAPAACKLRTRIIPSCTMKKKTP